MKSRSTLDILAHSLRAGVLDAYWHPLYDLYTTSEDGKPSPNVSLHYRVNLQQYTGEDWTSAKLVLSTSATDTLNAGIPKPDDLIIEPPISLPPPGYVTSPRYTPGSPGFSPTSPSICSSIQVSVAEDDDMGFGLLDGDDIVPQSTTVPAPLPSLAQCGAFISKSPMTVSYTVETLTTIPSDSVSYKVLVAVIPFEAVITHITTPRKSPIAYLQVTKEALLRAPS